LGSAKSGAPPKKKGVYLATRKLTLVLWKVMADGYCTYTLYCTSMGIQTHKKPRIPHSAALIFRYARNIEQLVVIYYILYIIYYIIIIIIIVSPHICIYIINNNNIIST